MIGADILSELAHELTVRECTYKGIAVDIETDVEITYTEEAQDIFIELYDLIDYVLATDGGGQP